MGNENSRPESKVIKSNQFSGTNGNENLNEVPYTSFSVTKDELKKKNHNNTAPTMPRQKQQEKVGTIREMNSDAQGGNNVSGNLSHSTDDIITVVRGNDGDDGDGDGIGGIGSGDRNRDEIMEQLYSLPSFQPLIKSTVSDGILKDLWNATTRTKHSSLQELDSIDSKPLIDLCAEFQTLAIQQSRELSHRQDVVLKKMLACQQHANKTTLHMTQQAQKMKKTSSSFREVERLSRYVSQCAKDVDNILEQLQRLERSLPHSVKSKIQTPLFGMLE